MATGDKLVKLDGLQAVHNSVMGDFAAAYSTSGVYAVGDYVTYGGKLYQCNTAIASPGEAWTSGHWTLATVGGELSELSGEIDTIQDDVNDINETLSGIPNYEIGVRLERSDGSLVDDSDFCVTEYIPVTAEGSLQFFYGEYSNKIYFVEYDANKEWVTYYGASPANVYRDIAGKQANTAYVRFAFNKGYAAKLMNGSYLLWEAERDGGIVDEVSTMQTTLTTLSTNLEAIAGTKTITTVTTPDVGTLTYGYVNTAGNAEHEPSTAAYYSEKIPVTEGMVFTRSTGGTMRFICAYNGETAVQSSGAESVASYTVPSGIDGIIITMSGASSASVATQQFGELRITQTSTVYAVDTDDELTDASLPANAKAVGDRLSVVENRKVQSYTWRGNLAASATHDTEIGFAPKIGFKCGLYAKFTGTFDQITLQFDEYSPNQIIIDSTKVYFKSRFYNDGNETHGITISGDVYINAHVDSDPSKIYVTISSGGTQATVNHAFTITAYETFKIINGTQALTDVVFSMGCGTINHRVWLIGDSYFGMTSANRWPYYAFQNGYTKNCLFCGSTGSGPAEAQLWVPSLLTMGTPKMIVFCMGMNYGVDTTEVNARWKADVEWLEDICEDVGAELILATIPSIPTRSNEYKNAYVRASDYRYIDFAKAVGAQADGTWTTGMLDVDGVHPTETGAIALYNMAISTVPELTFDYQ